jgi:nucleotide-binding universal stress UspA family protein
VFGYEWRFKMKAIERILVPIDFSESSLKTVDEAVEFSRPYEAELILLFVVERMIYESPLMVIDSGALLKNQARIAEEKLEEICRRLRKGGVKCRAAVESGAAYQAIVEAAKRFTRIDCYIDPWTHWVGAHFDGQRGREGRATRGLPGAGGPDPGGAQATLAGQVKAVDSL